MTTAQIAAIIFILQVFGVDPSTIAQIQAELTPVVVTTPVQQPTNPTTPTNPTPPVTPQPIPVVPTTPVSNPPAGGTTPVVQSPNKPTMDPRPFIVFASALRGDANAATLQLDLSKPITLASTTLPDGVTFGDVSLNGVQYQNGTRDGAQAGDPGVITTVYKVNGVSYIAYSYRVILVGVTEPLQLTFTDSDGNKITKNISFN